MDGLAVDLMWVAALAAVTLFDGVRRVPGRTYVFRSYLGERWRAGAGPERSALRIVSWWAPFTLTLVPSPDASGTSFGGDNPPRDRLRRIKTPVLMLILTGSATLLALVVGLPVAAGMWGTPGFLAALGATLLLSVMTALIFGVGLGRLGITGTARMTEVVFAAWPFSAPAAAERLLDRALEDASSFAVARLLLTQPALRSWIRTRAWDVLHGRLRDPAMEAEFTRDELNELVSHLSAPAMARSACMRCGTTWFEESGDCADCGVGLVRLA